VRPKCKIHHTKGNCIFPLLTTKLHATVDLRCCRRDRLATSLQLLLPVLLVFVGLAASQIEMFGRNQPPLLLSRQLCMRGEPALLAAAPVVMEQQAQQLQQFIEAYPRWGGVQCTCL
jgi:hypothetical protein